MVIKAQTDGAFFVARYLKDPERYVREVLGVKTIEPWQSKVLKAIAEGERRIAVGSGHGVGKSALLSWIIHWFNAVHDDPQTVVTANTESQLSTKTWRELGIWHERAINKDWFEHTATRFYLKSAPKTWFASAIPWTENRSEAFAGTHAKHVLYVFDEASAIADIIWEVSEGAMTSEGSLWLVFGNPTRNTGRFRECWGKFKHRWKTFQVDSREVSFTDKAQIQKWMDDYGEDSDFFRVRVKGQFPSAGTFQFIALSDVEACMAKKEEVSPLLAKIMGIDLARSGACQNVITYRQGRKVYPQVKFRESDTTVTVNRIVNAIQEEQPDAVFIDGGGLGGPIIDSVRALCNSQDRAKIFEINGGHEATDKIRYRNKRAEMWGLTREFVRNGGELPNDQELRDDLIGPEYFFDSKQRVQLESKEDMQGRGLASPDCADSLTLTFAHPVLKDRVDDSEPVHYPQSFFAC